MTLEMTHAIVHHLQSLQPTTPFSALASNTYRRSNIHLGLKPLRTGFGAIHAAFSDRVRGELQFAEGAGKGTRIFFLDCQGYSSSTGYSSSKKLSLAILVGIRRRRPFLSHRFNEIGRGLDCGFQDILSHHRDESCAGSGLTIY